MRANEILVESAEQLDEAPVGALSRLFTNIGAKMGLSGSQIQKQVNTEMMRVKQELNPIIKARDGVLVVKDFIDFMKAKGYGNDAQSLVKAAKKAYGSRPADPLTGEEIDYVIKNAVATGYANKGGFGVGRYGAKERPAKSNNPTQKKSSGKIKGLSPDQLQSLQSVISTMTPEQKRALGEFLSR